MPGTPSYLGCEACRVRKKKASGGSLETRCLLTDTHSATYNDRRARDVEWLRRSVKELDSVVSNLL